MTLCGEIGLVACLLLFLLRTGVALKKRLRKASRTIKYIGFFHPYCSNGGGGERVLWLTIWSLLRERKICDDVTVVIYTGDSEPDEVNYAKYSS